MKTANNPIKEQIENLRRRLQEDKFHTVADRMLCEANLASLVVFIKKS